MLVDFIKLRIRESVRSSAWLQSLVISIVSVFMMLYMALVFLSAGFFLGGILREAFPNHNPVEIFNSILFYYFGLEMLTRFFMQHTPAMSITPFLHLPVNRPFLMHFLLVRSAVSPMNYVSLLMFIPFAIRNVSVSYSGTAALWWLLAMLVLIVFVIYATVYIKRQLAAKPIIPLFLGLAYLAFLVLDYFRIFSLSSLSSFLFNALLQQPFWVVIPFLMAAGVYVLNYRFLVAHSYPEEIDYAGEGKQVVAQNLNFVSRFGIIGERVGVELKLMLRHNRTKSTIYLTPLFTLYALFFYNNPRHGGDNIILLVLIGLFITSFTMTNYGQLVVAWEGKFFDGILTREGGLLDYFRAKYYLLSLLCLASYALTIPYVYFGIKILLINAACCLFHIGVSTHVMLLFARYSRKRIDLSQSAAMNWKGLGASHFIKIIPLFFMPVVIVSIFDLLKLPFFGVGALALLGIIGIYYHNQLIHGICHSFDKVKYVLAESYRTNN